MRDLPDLFEIVGRDREIETGEAFRKRCQADGGFSGRGPGHLGRELSRPDTAGDFRDGRRDARFRRLFHPAGR